MRHCFIHFSILLIALVCLSAAAYTPEPLVEADLKRQLDADEILELSAQGPFLVLKRDHMTAFQRGTVIIVSDWSEHGASPKYLDLLRQQLPDIGWNTLAFMPPPQPESLEEPVVQAYQEHLQQRMTAAWQQASLLPGAVVIIAQGSSAAMLNALYVDNKLSMPAAFIMLGAYLPEQQLNKQLAQLIALNPIPILDISTDHDNRFVTSQLKRRHQLAEKHFKAVYRQRLINGSGYNDDVQRWVLQEIYGWLISVGL